MDNNVSHEVVVSCETYYDVLNLRSDCNQDDIRRAYRKLAKQWHPDKWAKTPTLLGEAKLKFQKIQEAYSVLSDPGKRILYDTGMYDPKDGDDEGFCDFMQEMWSLMSQVKEEEVASSMEDLQGMLVELVQGFDTPQWSSSPFFGGSQGCSANFQRGTVPNEEASHRHNSTLGVFGMSNCCG